MTYYLRSHLGKQQFEKWWSGSSGQIEIKPTELNRFIIPDNTLKGIPLKNQKIIAKKVTDRLDRIKNLEIQKSHVISETEDEFTKLITIP